MNQEGEVKINTSIKEVLPITREKEKKITVVHQNLLRESDGEEADYQISFVLKNRRHKNAVIKAERDGFFSRKNARTNRQCP